MSFIRRSMRRSLICQDYFIVLNYSLPFLSGFFEVHSIQSFYKPVFGEIGAGTGQRLITKNL